MHQKFVGSTASRPSIVEETVNARLTQLRLTIIGGDERGELLTLLFVVVRGFQR